MRIRIEMEIEVTHPVAQKATDEQVKEWVEFNLGSRKELKPSPIADFDTTFNFEPKLKKVLKVIR